jgi:hypothetical protein
MQLFCAGIVSHAPQRSVWSGQGFGYRVELAGGQEAGHGTGGLDAEDSLDPQDKRAPSG